MEMLNAAEVFGRIMIEYDYPECTTAVVTALSLFSKHYPDYRAADVKVFKDRAIKYIRTAQRPDGSWYGSWGICFTYAGMFALESLASIDETYENSEHVRKGCDFFISKQRSDGGWCESYKVGHGPVTHKIYTVNTMHSLVNKASTLSIPWGHKLCRQHGHALDSWRRNIQTEHRSKRP
jgi:squalene cyclase